MTAKPAFILDQPEPHVKQRLYNGRKLVVWEGKVNIASIQGWVENPRIEIAKKKLVQKVGNRQLTQDEIFDLMKNDPEVKLRDLRDDIIKNGLREPLTLSFGGKLLDGNRRFFALKFALETMPATDPNRQDLETVNAYNIVAQAAKGAFQMACYVNAMVTEYEPLSAALILHKVEDEKLEKFVHDALNRLGVKHMTYDPNKKWPERVSGLLN